MKKVKKKVNVMRIGLHDYLAMVVKQEKLQRHSGHQFMNPPPPNKTFTPLFLAKPPSSKFEIVQAPAFAPTPLFMRKVLVNPSFFTKSCFMKPIVRYHEISLS